MTSTAEFYDLLADDYHLIYSDWSATITGQATVLDAIIQDEVGPGRKTILDCACGIGTQTLGLARLGHQLAASDLSSMAVARAKRESKEAGLDGVNFEVASFLTLSQTWKETFTVLIACDNSIPHLLTISEMQLALENLKTCMETGGLLLISTRDYDQILLDRPVGTIPKLIDVDGIRRVVFQVWDWQDDYRYKIELFLLMDTGNGWKVKSVRTEYRAWMRQELEDLLTAGGFSEIRWRFPNESGYYQPVLTARKIA